MAAGKRKTPPRPPTVAFRYPTDRKVKELVWIRAAGHCEMCGVDLTHDYRVGQPMKQGDVAHIMPASPQGPGADAGHGAVEAQALTNDPENLILLCPNCHRRVDWAPDRYPRDDLGGLHQAALERIRVAAKTPDSRKALPIIFLSQHHATVNSIRPHDLLSAMSAEGLSAIGQPIIEKLPAPASGGRDSAYWDLVDDRIKHHLSANLGRASSFYGDIPALAVAGLADIPALMMFGQAIGDRCTRYLFSPSRGNGLRWPDTQASPPEFVYHAPTDGDGPLALVLSLSARVPSRDVLEALPGARIAEFTIADPGVAMVTNRGVIHAFRDALQTCLSKLEASTGAAIHVFSAIPAALAIEFGALLTMQHQHPYLVYDRDGQQGNAFRPALTLGPMTKEMTA